MLTSLFAKAVISLWISLNHNSLVLNFFLTKERLDILGRVTVIVTFYIIGIIFYVKVEGWSRLDSAYFMSQFLATLGYGDIYPSYASSKAFSVGVLFLGILLVTKTFIQLFEDLFTLLLALLLKSEFIRGTLFRLESRPFQNFAVTICIWLIAISSLILSMAAYMSHQEGWTFLESFYFVVVTASLIGCGDFAPETYNGRVAVCLFVFISSSVIVLLIAYTRRASETWYRYRRLRAAINDVLDDTALYSDIQFITLVLCASRITCLSTQIKPLCEKFASVSSCVFLSFAELREKGERELRFFEDNYSKFRSAAGEIHPDFCVIGYAVWKNIITSADSSDSRFVTMNQSNETCFHNICALSPALVTGAMQEGNTSISPDTTLATATELLDEEQFATLSKKNSYYTENVMVWAAVSEYLQIYHKRKLPILNSVLRILHVYRIWELLSLCLYFFLTWIFYSNEEAWENFEIFYYVCQTFTIIGIGDIWPTSNNSLLFTSLFTIPFGVFWALPNAATLLEVYMYEPLLPPFRLCLQNWKIGPTFFFEEKIALYVTVNMCALFIGAGIFSSLEGWSYGEAFYCTIMIMTTVGDLSQDITLEVTKSVACGYMVFSVGSFMIALSKIRDAESAKPTLDKISAVIASDFDEVSALQIRNYLESMDFSTHHEGLHETDFLVGNLLRTGIMTRAEYRLCLDSLHESRRKRGGFDTIH